MKTKASLADKVLPKPVQDAIERTIEPHIYERASGIGVCSTKTAKERRQHIRATVATLWQLGSKIQKLESLSPKHIALLTAHWDQEGMSPEFLHNRLSVLRTLAGWMGKRNLVGDLGDYFEKARTQRTTATEVDKSWKGKEIDVEAIIARATQIDERLGVMIALMDRFGLRVKEAIEFRPAQALVDGGTAIEVFAGTKGGKLRRVPVETDQQRETLAWARDVVAQGRVKRVRWPELTWKKAQSRFYNTIQRKLGIAKAQLGVTMHGLRHGYGQRGYEKVAGVPSPIVYANANHGGENGSGGLGGEGGSDGEGSVGGESRGPSGTRSRPLEPPAGLTREKHREASMAVSRWLGHGRVDVTAAYYGTYGHAFRRSRRNE